MLPKVNIIILNWNGLDDTRTCLESLKKIKYNNYKILVVDNGSKNSEANKLENEYSDYITVIKNNTNLGFTGGNNIAIEKILKDDDSKYILLLNNDTTCESNFLEKLIAVAEKNKDIGIVGPKIIYSHDKKTIQSIGAKINFYTGKVHNIGQQQIDTNQYQNNIEVDYVPGCALLIKTEVIKKIGPLNNDYFAYWEETDWCFKAKKAGYKTLAVPNAKIYHKEYGSSKNSYFSDYQINRNKLWFLRTHSSALQYIIFNLYFWLFTVPARLLKRQNLKIFFKAIKDGYKNL